MVFNSASFLVFFGAVLALCNLTKGRRARNGVLLAASYLFYAAWNPPFVILLWISTFVDWLVGLALGRETRPRARRALLGISLLTNLGMLGFFKYGPFLLENVVAGLRAFGIAYRPAAIDIVLPVGISFYSFQTLSYSFDVYRREIPPCRSLLDFSLFVAFFPHLVAGPIMRPHDLLPQFEREPRETRSRLGWGFALLTIGLVEKMTLADAVFAPVADLVFRAPNLAGPMDAWIGALAFSGQIYFDFSGYSTCAIGAAMCLGFALPDNFHCPYAAVGFADFWRRWHISLSTWLRDYLYIPLGGNRRGRSRTIVNLFVTMFLGGLWHGASWRFVAWGGLHGVFLALERPFQGRIALERGLASLVRPLVATFTFATVSIAWVFFRADDFAAALRLIATMFGRRVSGQVASLVSNESRLLIAVAIVLMLAGQWSLRNTRLEFVVNRFSWPVRALALAALLIALILSPVHDRAFIYFQF